MQLWVETWGRAASFALDALRCVHGSPALLDLIPASRSTLSRPLTVSRDTDCSAHLEGYASPILRQSATIQRMVKPARHGYGKWPLPQSGWPLEHRSR